MLTLALPLVLTITSVVTQSVPRERAFWVGIIASKYEVPAGEKPFELLVEMDALLGSTDPVLRDDVAYSAAAQWISRKGLLTPEQQKTLLTKWTDNLGFRIGERDTDSVFRRSFSALNLSILAARDIQAPFLSQAEFDTFLDRTLRYLADEKDTRGFEKGKGWIHTPAHTADVLKFLARNPRLPPAQQGRLLTAVSAKAAAVGHAFTWGEDERLAQVIRSIARRPDFDTAAFGAWLDPLGPAARQLWANGPSIDPDRFSAVQNMKTILRAAFTALSADTDLPPTAERARLQILKILSGM